MFFASAGAISLVVAFVLVGLLAAATVLAANRRLGLRGGMASTPGAATVLERAFEDARRRTDRYLALLAVANRAIGASVGLLAAVTTFAIPLLHKGASGLIQSGCLLSLADVILAMLVASLAIALNQKVTASDLTSLQSSVTRSGVTVQDYATVSEYSLSAARRLGIMAVSLLVVGLAGFTALALLTAGQWRA